MSTYFAELIPKAKDHQVDTLAICLARDDDGAADWFATVKFKDYNLYHYRLHLPPEAIPMEKPVELVYFNTEDMRADEARHGSPRRGCYDGTEDYRFEVYSGVKGYVLKETTIHTPFDERVKSRLKRAAQAVEAAGVAHKNYVPVAETWGIKS